MSLFCALRFHRHNWQYRIPQYLDTVYNWFLEQACKRETDMSTVIIQKAVEKNSGKYSAEFTWGWKPVADSITKLDVFRQYLIYKWDKMFVYLRKISKTSRLRYGLCCNTDDYITKNFIGPVSGMSPTKPRRAIFFPKLLIIYFIDISISFLVLFAGKQVLLKYLMVLYKYYRSWTKRLSDDNL